MKLFKLERRDGSGPSTDSGVTVDKETGENKPQKSNYSVVAYVAVLFAVVVLLITLSYLVQNRENQETISSLTEQHNVFSTQAMANIDRLQDRNMELEAQGKEYENTIDELTAKNEKLEKEISEKDEAISGLESENEELKKLVPDTEATKMLNGYLAAVASGDREGIIVNGLIIENAKNRLTAEQLEIYNTVKESLVIEDDNKEN